MSIVYGILPTPLGPMGALAGGRGLLATILPGPGQTELTRRLLRRAPDARRDDGAFSELAAQVKAYFAGGRATFDLTVDLSEVPPFTRTVLTALRKVGFGKTLSYGELARKVGKPKAARAVGQAMARNPLPLVIPCHRVLGGDRSLHGFSADGGLKLKSKMLEIEGADGVG